MVKRMVRYPGRLSRLSFFTRMEMAELPRLLMSGEQVLGVISGFANGATVLLAVTSQRLLLVDKKWMHLSYEDVRYESINEVTFSQQMVLGSAKFYVMGKDILFKSWYRTELRMLVEFVQDKMFELRPATKADTKKYGYKRSGEYQTIMEAPTLQRQEETRNVLEHMREASAQPLQVPRHITDRVARWQSAARFVGNLSRN